MIQLNLLPDIKLEYIKAKRMKRTVTTVATLVASVSLLSLIILFVAVNVLQKKHLNDLNKDIKSSSQKLQNTPDLNKILTIQNQLNSLTGLHDQKPVVSRLFTYLSQVTPDKVSISKLDVDFEGHTISLNGGADSLSTINKFADTLKFTTYTADDGSIADDTKAFSNVVLTNFGKTDKEASYQISVTFDEAIFDNTASIKLVVPKLVTSRSETEKPAALFQNQTQGGQ
jgi:Tfp pilus assembly protein PilN